MLEVGGSLQGERGPPARTSRSSHEHSNKDSEEKNYGGGASPRGFFVETKWTTHN